jgi:hypothetical protein
MEQSLDCFALEKGLYHTYRQAQGQFRLHLIRGKGTGFLKHSSSSVEPPVVIEDTSVRVWGFALIQSRPMN